MISIHFKKGALLGGIGVTGLWFFSSRIVQLLSGLWITRQLAPEDFTLLATVFAIQGFAQQITGINLSSHLVRAKRIDASDLQVAWSYEFIRNLLIFGVIFSFAPHLASWMERPEATLPLQISASGLLIGALRNPRIVELRRDGKFGLLGALDAIPAIAYAALAVGFVIFHKSYWSLIYAGLGSAVISIIVTYIGLPWKPAFNFDTSRAKPMFTFGIVILAVAGFMALREHGMVFLISKGGLSSDLGYYNRAIAFSLSLALQGVSVFWRVAYPHYSRMEIEGECSLRKASTIQKWILLAGIPLAGVAVLAGRPLIPLVLGEQWIPLIPIWSGYVIAGVFALANAPFEASLQARGSERLVLWMGATTTLTQMAISWYLMTLYGIAGVSFGAIVALALTSASYHLIHQRLSGGIPVKSI